jgi:hypothetical protein
MLCAINHNFVRQNVDSMLVRLFLILLLSPLLLLGQGSHVAVGLHGWQYAGSLSTVGSVSTGPGLSMGYQYQLENLVDLEAELGYTRLQGGGLISYAVLPVGVMPVSQFQTDLVYLRGGFNYHFISWGGFSTYGGIGLSFLGFDPKDRSGSSLYNQSDTRLAGETYSRLSVGSDISLGMRWTLQSQWQVGAGMRGMVPFTQYLDNTYQLDRSRRPDLLLNYHVSLLIPFGSGRQPKTISQQPHVDPWAALQFMRLMLDFMSEFSSLIR